MTKIRKIFVSVAVIAALAVVTVASALFAGCTSSVESKIYTNQRAYYENGRVGDVINSVTTALTLNSDGSYVIVENTAITHIDSTNIVTYWTYTIEGKWSETSVEENEMTIALEKATNVTWVFNGTVTTPDVDATVMDYGLAQGGTCVCDTDTLKFEFGDDVQIVTGVAE